MVSSLQEIRVSTQTDLRGPLPQVTLNEGQPPNESVLRLWVKDEVGRRMEVFFGSGQQSLREMQVGRPFLSSVSSIQCLDGIFLPKSSSFWRQV